MTRASRSSSFSRTSDSSSATSSKKGTGGVCPLDGSGSGDILNTKVKMSCETMTPMDDTSIPTGEIVPVEGTPFDFTSEQTIGARIKDITCPSAGGGYDHNLVVKADGWGKLSRAYSSLSFLPARLHIRLARASPSPPAAIGPSITPSVIPAVQMLRPALASVGGR